MTDTDGRGIEWDEWEVHGHDGPLTVRYESDSGKITIYGGDEDDAAPLVWDLYPSEASSLATALNNALLMCERDHRAAPRNRGDGMMMIDPKRRLCVTCMAALAELGQAKCTSCSAPCSAQDASRSQAGKAAPLSELSVDLLEQPGIDPSIAAEYLQSGQP